MKKVIYVVLIAAAMAVPTRPLELGKLKPVEVISINKTEETVLIETDTGDFGRGKTVEQAIRDLQETTAGTVYLDTAEYLLLPKDATVLAELSPYLKENVRLCCRQGAINLEEAAKFLDAHKPEVMLRQYRQGTVLQTLEQQDGKLRLKK